MQHNTAAVLGPAVHLHINNTGLRITDPANTLMS